VSEPAPSGAGPGDGRVGADAVAAAKDALDAAREAVAALVTVRAKALQEGRRLRDRAEAPGLDELGEGAGLQERRAQALEPRIEQLRDLARRAEVAYESLRVDRGGADAPSGASGSPDAGGPRDADENPDAGRPADEPGPGGGA
jgi:hypothetical protein